MSYQHLRDTSSIDGSHSKREENITYTPRGIHPSASSPAIRKPNYSEAVYSNGPLVDESTLSGGITFLDPERKNKKLSKKSFSGSDVKPPSRSSSRSSEGSSLAVIKEEGNLTRRFNGSWDSLVEEIESDHSTGSESGIQRERSKLKKRGKLVTVL